MIIEHYIGLVLFLFISFTALISVKGWMKADREAKELRREKEMMKKRIQNLYDDLAAEKSWASIVNLETEDK